MKSNHERGIALYLARSRISSIICVGWIPAKHW
jgi:hypothetical protein